MPFDAFCPSLVKKGCLAKRLCKKCGLYFPSIAGKNRHNVIHLEEQGQDSDDDGEDSEQPEPAEAVEHAPVFRNIFEIMAGPFEYCD